MVARADRGQYVRDIGLGRAGPRLNMSIRDHGTATIPISATRPPPPPTPPPLPLSEWPGSRNSFNVSSHISTGWKQDDLRLHTQYLSAIGRLHIGGFDMRSTAEVREFEPSHAASDAWVTADGRGQRAHALRRRTLPNGRSTSSSSATVIPRPIALVTVEPGNQPNAGRSAFFNVLTH